VTREHQPPAVGTLRARGEEQVGLLPIRRRIPRDPDAGPIDVVTDEIGQREVAEIAGRVDPDEAREKDAVGERVSRGRQAPGSLARTLITTWRASRVSAARKTRLMPPPSSLRIR